jgi:hypothetical protein
MTEGPALQEVSGVFFNPPQWSGSSFQSLHKQSNYLDPSLHLHLLLLGAIELATNIAKNQNQNMNFKVIFLLLTCLFIMSKCH